ncbi:MAG: glycosyltransferase [Thaumarchaeota archaeon]|nr:glycosyltransferase [Nitrososphaerota archaeon]
MSQSQAEKFFWRKDPTEEEDPSKPKSKDAVAPEETQAKKPQIRSSLVIGIPCHNAEGQIARIVVNLSGLGAEIVVCDDGSTDATDEIARKLGCSVVKHPRELGKSDSITSLFLAAKKLQAEVLLTVAASSKITLLELSRLIDSVHRGDVDIAIGTACSTEEIEAARHNGELVDRESPVRAYGKKSLTMISPPGTGSVVVEKEVLEFADQQGLKVREFSISGIVNEPQVSKTKSPVIYHFESRFMTFVAVKHPLVFVGFPAIAFLYAAVLETVLLTNFAGFSWNWLATFALSLGTSPLLLVSVILAMGSAILYSQKALDKKLEKTESIDSKL